MFFASFLSALLWIYWGHLFHPQNIGLGQYLGEVVVTMFVLLNLFLFYPRSLLRNDFDAIAGGIFSRSAIILMWVFTIVPLVVLTAVLPTSAPPFGRNLFWMSYIGLGTWLWVWNISTKLITPKAGTIARVNDGTEYHAGSIIPAPLFGSINSLPRVISDKKKRM
jgi:hypothetical protein